MMSKTRPFQHAKQHFHKGRKFNWKSTFFLYVSIAENDQHERMGKVQNRPSFHNNFIIFFSFSDFFRKTVDSCFSRTMRNCRPEDNLADLHIDGAVNFVWNKKTSSLWTELKNTTGKCFQKWRRFKSIEMTLNTINIVIWCCRPAWMSAVKARPVCCPEPTWKDVNWGPISVSSLMKMQNKSMWPPNVWETNGVPVFWQDDSGLPKVTPYPLNSRQHRRRHHRCHVKMNRQCRWALL